MLALTQVGLAIAIKAAQPRSHGSEVERALTATEIFVSVAVLILGAVAVADVRVTAVRADVAQRAAAAEAGVRRVQATADAAASQVSDVQSMFLQLARRCQTLVNRQFRDLEELLSTEDPVALKALYRVDHAATRIRRHAESTALLGGATSARQWTMPVAVATIQRSAVAETEDYGRVTVMPRAPGHIVGGAVADVIHMLSELVENATSFSKPDTMVTVSALVAPAGLVIAVNDHGVGMPGRDREAYNALLRDPSGEIGRSLLLQGRIGLNVVARLARRCGITVQLEENVAGGTRATVVIPRRLLADDMAQQLTDAWPSAVTRADHGVGSVAWSAPVSLAPMPVPGSQPARAVPGPRESSPAVAGSDETKPPLPARPAEAAPSWTAPSAPSAAPRLRDADPATTFRFWVGQQPTTEADPDIPNEQDKP